MARGVASGGGVACKGGVLGGELGEIEGTGACLYYFGLKAERRRHTLGKGIRVTLRSGLAAENMTP